MKYKIIAPGSKLDGAVPERSHVKGKLEELIERISQLSDPTNEQEVLAILNIQKVVGGRDSECFIKDLGDALKLALLLKKMSKDSKNRCPSDTVTRRIMFSPNGNREKVALSLVGQAIQAAKLNEILTMPSITSTAESMRHFQGFGTNFRNIIITYVIENARNHPRSIDIRSYSASRGEQETVFLPGTEYKVLSVHAGEESLLQLWDQVDQQTWAEGNFLSLDKVGKNIIIGIRLLP